ncbi:hypothetical protein [Vibrio marisflavi]|uniref:Lipoprotein n=1 Tax=Vibrio marisflavi CECT 7928 TaxID=634439 RepID=A0ABN8E7D8_9VIBR|nr:hypothetical protein [Vibrio marisflavi]CAH0541665.1 hypothetical protein VMF7928_03731 [Vibrio marisflavi CECT 7928]
MNKFKLAILALGAAIALSGCQTLNPQDIQTTASTQTIEFAKQHIKPTHNGRYDVAVYDNGVIYIKFKKAPGTIWLTAETNEAGYRVACENLRPYVDKGMVVEVNFQGNGARQYNQHRCETETPTNLFANWN